MGAQIIIGQTLMQETVDYEARVAHQVSGCPNLEFVCEASNSLYLSRKTIKICEKGILVLRNIYNYYINVRYNYA